MRSGSGLTAFSLVLDSIDMGLFSALQTARSSLSVASLTLQVSSDNLANVQTDGFKQAQVVRASQTPQTFSLGSSNQGGSNPVQVGRGVQAVAVVRDFSQGTIEISNNPLDLAIEGDAFFIVEGEGGSRSFTRNGRFQLNSARELVTSTGDRVLGFAADSDGNIDNTQLTTLTIPVGFLHADAEGNVDGFNELQIGEDGVVRAISTGGETLDLGQLALAQLNNPQGLTGTGSNRFEQAPNSGEPVISAVSETPGAGVRSGAVELSNTDIGKNLVDMMLSREQFKIGLRVINTSSELLEELTGLARR